MRSVQEGTVVARGAISVYRPTWISRRSFDAGRTLTNEFRNIITICFVFINVKKIIIVKYSQLD